MTNNVHLRFDSNDSHTRMTVFIRGANCGQLTLRPEEAVWFHHIVQQGCDALQFNFLASGHGPEPSQAEMDGCAVTLNKSKVPS